MHRAVSARLEDPNLTLYEALKIGGFSYPNNDDSSLLDSEKVTLGQRKNQLSRRLRLARKQNEGAGSSSNGGGSVDGYRATGSVVGKKGPHNSLGSRVGSHSSPGY